MALPFRRELFEITDEELLAEPNPVPGDQGCTASTEPGGAPAAARDAGRGSGSSNAASQPPRRATSADDRAVGPRLAVAALLLSTPVAIAAIYRGGEPERPMDAKPAANAAQPAPPTAPDRAVKGDPRAGSGYRPSRVARPSRPKREALHAPRDLAATEVDTAPTFAPPQAPPPEPARQTDAVAPPARQPIPRSHEFDFERWEAAP
jgi:hypothetical protein